MAPRAVFFDIGGVVVHDYSYAYVTSAAQVFGTTAGPFLDEMKKHIKALETGKSSSLEVWPKVARALGRKLRQERYSGLWRELLEGRIRVNQKVLSLCHDLKEKENLIVGALSNVLDDQADILEEMGVYSDFYPKVLSCQVGLRKPDRRIYLMAAKQVGLKPQECLFVDDSPTNVKAAEKVGMQAHLYEDVELLIAFIEKALSHSDYSTDS